MSPRIPIAGGWGARRLGRAEEQIREVQKQGPGPWVWVGDFPSDSYTTYWSPQWENGWDRPPPPYGLPAFRHSVDGRIEFAGIPDGTAAVSGTVAFTLPADWWIDRDASVIRDVLVGSRLVAARWAISESTGEVTITLIEAPQAVQEIKVFSDLDNVTTGDGKFIYAIEDGMGGMNLVDADAFITTVGGGVTTVQIRNISQGADMLSTPITIDAGETTSYTAATQPVINLATDDVATGDLISIDVDTASGKGLGVILSYALPT